MEPNQCNSDKINRSKQHRIRNQCGVIDCGHRKNNLLYWFLHCSVFKGGVSLQHDKQLLLFHATVGSKLWPHQNPPAADIYLTQKLTTNTREHKTGDTRGLHYIRWLTSLIHGFKSVTVPLICIQSAANDVRCACLGCAWVHWYSAEWMLR